MNGLFGQVKSEVEAAKNILADIRNTLRNDGPDQALEQKRLALDGDHNPILNARKLLEQVAQRFKNQPSKEEMNLIADLHNQVDKLAKSEENLQAEINNLPEELDEFNAQIEEVSDWLNAASAFSLANDNDLEKINSAEGIQNVASLLDKFRGREGETIQRMGRLRSVFKMMIFYRLRDAISGHHRFENRY